jgi:hypothetical protein
MFYNRALLKFELMPILPVEKYTIAFSNLFTYSLKSSLYLKDNLRLVALFSVSGNTCVCCVHTKVAYACHSK